MAYTSCAAQVAANIGEVCASPNEGGYTGRAVYIPKSYAPTLTKDASNPRIISAISLESGQKTVAIENLSAQPFNGGTTTANAETNRFDKTFACLIPQRGAAVAEDIVEPLMRSPLGGILVLEKVDASGDGSYEMLGVGRGVKATEITRNEYENNGAWSATLSASEYYAESVLFDTDYDTTKAAFEALLALAY